jgi:ethanolamine utilization protein EutQ (cupin superfamily)
MEIICARRAMMCSRLSTQNKCSALLAQTLSKQLRSSFWNEVLAGDHVNNQQQPKTGVKGQKQRTSQKIIKKDDRDPTYYFFAINAITLPKIDFLIII